MPNGETREQERARLAQTLLQGKAGQALAAKFPDIASRVADRQQTKMRLLQDLDAQAELLSKQIQRIINSYGDKFQAANDPMILQLRERLVEISQQQFDIIQDEGLPTQPGMVTIGTGEDALQFTEAQIERLQDPDDSFLQDIVANLERSGNVGGMNTLSGFVGEQFLNERLIPTDVPIGEAREAAPVDIRERALGGVNKIIATIRSFLEPRRQRPIEPRAAVEEISSELKSATQRELRERF